MQQLTDIQLSLLDALSSERVLVMDAELDVAGLEDLEELVRVGAELLLCVNVLVQHRSADCGFEGSQLGESETGG